MDWNENPCYWFKYKYAILGKQLKQVHANFRQPQMVKWYLRFYLEKFNSCALPIITLPICTWATCPSSPKRSFWIAPPWTLFTAPIVTCQKEQRTHREATVQLTDEFLLPRSSFPKAGQKGKGSLHLFKTTKPTGFNYHGQQKGILNLYTSASPEPIWVSLV